MDQIALLHRTYKFKKNAPLLKYFITKQSKQPAPTFTLPTILIEVLALFEEEKCYDTHNNNIIFCNSQLTKALNVLALHVSQIKKYVLKQLICTDQPKKHVNNTFLIKQPVFKNQTLLPIHYILSYSLRRVFKTLSSFPTHRMVFSYSEICSFMSQYIVFNAHCLFDERNKFVCIIKNDILKKAFHCNAFHRCQLTKLIKKNVFIKK